MGSFVTGREADIVRLARLSGLGALPYRSFHNAPVRRAPAPPPPVEAAQPSAAVLSLPGLIGEGAPVLRVISGMGGTAARPSPAMRPVADLPLIAPAAARRPPAVRTAAAPGFGLLARALGGEVEQAPAPPAVPIATAATDRNSSSFPLLLAALRTGGGPQWR
jgi:hypothetical protein